MDFSLNIKQELKLILTQSMKLSLNILEMSSFELEKYLIGESVKNPFIDISYGNNFKFSRKSEEISPLDFVHEEKNLIDFLEEQISYLNIKKNQISLYIFIVNNLDSRGYLNLNIKEIRNLTKYSSIEIEEALKVIKNFEPDGIGASNLEECLIIQLKKKGIEDIKLEYIIRNFLKEMALEKFKEIGERLDLSEGEVINKLKIIRTLNPIPSRGFYMGDKIRYVVPEAEIKKINGKYIVVMNETVVKVKLKNNFGVEKVKGNEYINSANNLIKFIEKRRETLKNILELVLKKQYSYFSKGTNKKYLSLKLVAQELGVHESTVSRAIKNKYIKTSNGVEKIRDLFILDEKKEKTNKLIEEIILKENREKPISDQEISERLNNLGIKIARRTVTKYREKLGIKVSSKRKLKKLEES